MNAFPGASNYSHWPANDSREFVGWVRATDEEVRTRATHTSFVNCGYSYGGVTPPRPSSWLFLTGAVTGGVDEATALAGSWLSRAKVESSHLFEGYSYSQRAYCFRTELPGPVHIRLSPDTPDHQPGAQALWRATPGEGPVERRRIARFRLPGAGG